MANNKKDIWFPAKRYGVGWGLPVTWQGWIVLLSYFLLVLMGALFLHFSVFPFAIVFFPVYVIFLSLLLIFICHKKGEAIDFRWGKQTDSP